MRALAACCLLVLTPAASALPERQTAVPSAPIAELLDAYDAGRFETVNRVVAGIPDLPKFSLALRREAHPWITAGTPETAQRRRLIAAAIALEAAGTHFHERDTGRELVEWGGLLARGGAPSEAERIWYLAVSALAQRWYDPVSPEIVQALLRFPKEDRFHLASAIAQELASWRPVQFAQLRDGGDGGKSILRDLVKAFEPLIGRGAIRSEVHLRLAQTYLRLGQPKVALEHLDRVEPLATPDPFLRYLSHYFSGKAREAMKEMAGAEAAYRRALEIVPGAQSASFAAAALAFDRDARDEANTAVEAVLARRTPVEDPWRSYQAGDARFWLAFIERLRKELR